MRRTVRLTERDLTRLVRRAIHEMDDQSEMGDNSLTTSAMDTVSEFLKSNGGGLGSRNNDDIEKNLKALEYAIRIERNGLRDSNQTPGYKNRSNNNDDYTQSNDPMDLYMSGRGVSGH
jgi:hypothetical protein